MTGTAPAARRDYGGRTATQRRAERRQRLMTAALDLFGTEGYPATSIERLGARANVSTRNFYEEFASREALLIALHDQITQQAYDAMIAAVDELPDERTSVRIDRAIEAYIGTTSNDPRWTRIAYVEVIGVSATVERHRLAWRAKLGEMLAAEVAHAVARGEATDRDGHRVGKYLARAALPTGHRSPAAPRHTPVSHWRQFHRVAPGGRIRPTRTVPTRPASVVRSSSVSGASASASTAARAATTRFAAARPAAVRVIAVERASVPARRRT